MNLSLERKIRAGFAATLGLLAIVGVISLRSIMKQAEVATEVAHTHEVLQKLHEMIEGLVKAEAGERGYVIAGDELFLDSYHSGIATFNDDLLRIKDLTLDNPSQQQRIAALTKAFELRVAQLKNTLEARRTRGFEAAQESVRTGRGRQQTETIRKIISETKDEELHLLALRIQERESAARFTILVNAVFVGLVGVLLLSSFIVIRRDVAERRHAQETVDRFFGLSLDMLCIAGFDGYFKRINPAWERNLGYTTQELLSKPWLDFVHPEDREATIAEGEKLFNGVDTVLFENRYICKDGSHRVLLWSAAPSREEKLIYAAARDITLRKRTEQDIRELNEALERRVLERTTQLEDASKELLSEITERKSLEAQLLQAQKMEAVGRLAGGVAHDFNNLLTVIAGFGELLSESLDRDSPLREYSEEIKKAAERASHLTRQLLAFGRRQILQPQVLDLNTVVADVDKMLRRLIGEDIQLRTVQSPGLGRVMADPMQIQQILLNLAVNSRDAMPKGGKLTIETANVKLDDAYARGHINVTPGPYVMLAVSDTGTGMDAETQAHIFEPFFTTKEKGKGTGLGLATVYGIVKQSGGNIYVYSEPGLGTTFKIYLPRVEEIVPPPTAIKPKEALPETQKTILLVEDEAGVRTLARKVMESKGFKVLEATHGEQALNILEDHEGPIHLLLTDVVMPRMSGRELAERLGDKHPEVKVLFMSGYTDEAIVNHGVLQSGIAFIPKPFTPDALVRKVHEILG